MNSSSDDSSDENSTIAEVKHREYATATLTTNTSIRTTNPTSISQPSSYPIIPEIYINTRFNLEKFNVQDLSNHLNQQHQLHQLHQQQPHQQHQLHQQQLKVN
ncbi:hypothetical protein ACTFIW_009154 [Dictyostelium discoideum]